MKYLLVSVFIFAVAVTCHCQAWAQELTISHDMQYAYAQQLLQDQDFDTAAIEFKRFLHFFPDSRYKFQVEFKIAQCLFYAKRYKEAARWFDSIILHSEDQKTVAQSVFYQSRCFVQLGNIGYAQLVLQNYLKLTEDILVKDQIYFNLAMIQVSNIKKGTTGSLETALKYLSLISENSQEKFLVQKQKSMLEHAQQAPSKSPTAAGVLSIVPGAGFAYCERYKDGAITFLLNVGLMVAAYQAWENDNKALAGVIGFVETGFYSANIYGAVSSAHKYNRSQVLKILDQEFYIQSKIEPEQNGVGLSFHFPF